MTLQIGMEDSLDLVKKMRVEHLNEYRAFRDKFAPHLATTPAFRGGIFTCHGYFHCVRILQHLNRILLPEMNVEMNSEALMYLCMANLVHDLIMTRDPDLRQRHSEEARRFIADQTSTQGLTALGIIARPWNDHEAALVGDVVYAHSDLKSKSGELLVRTLLEVARKAPVAGRTESGRIDVGLLAALLRFGDELDCTAERCEDAQGLQYEKERQQNSHFRACGLIRQILPGTAPHLKLKVEVFEDKILRGGDFENDCGAVHKTLNKLRTALQEVNREVFEPRRVQWWRYTEVELAELREPSVRGGIEGTEGRSVSDRESWSGCTFAENGCGVLGKPTTRLPHVPTIDASIDSDLREWVGKYGLLKSGHYRITDERHALDWLDTSRLLSEPMFVKRMASSFVEELRRKYPVGTDITVVGEGFPGLILAAQIGVMGMYRSTYVIPANEQCHHGTHETAIDIPRESTVVLVTDVVAQGKTLERTIDSLRTTAGVDEDRIAQILTVFRRPPVGLGDALPQRIATRLFPLNSCFPIQMCGRAPADCVLFKNGSVVLMNAPD